MLASDLTKDKHAKNRAREQETAHYSTVIVVVDFRGAINSSQDF